MRNSQSPILTCRSVGEGRHTSLLGSWKWALLSQTPRNVHGALLILLLFAAGGPWCFLFHFLKGFPKTIKLTSGLINGSPPMVPKTLTRCFWPCGPQSTYIRTEQAKNIFLSEFLGSTPDLLPEDVLVKPRNCHVHPSPRQSRWALKFENLSRLVSGQET